MSFKKTISTILMLILIVNVFIGVTDILRWWSQVIVSIACIWVLYLTGFKD